MCVCSSGQSVNAPELLRQAVRSALRAAVNHQIISLALPLLGSDVFWCPAPVAAEIVVAAVVEFLRDMGPEIHKYLKVNSCVTMYEVPM